MHYSHCLSKHWFMFMAVKEGCSLVKVCHLMIRCYSTPCRAIHTVLANTGSCLWQSTYVTFKLSSVMWYIPTNATSSPPPHHLSLVLTIISYCNTNSMALIMNMHHCQWGTQKWHFPMPTDTATVPTLDCEVVERVRSVSPFWLRSEPQERAIFTQNKVALAPVLDVFTCNFTSKLLWESESNWSQNNRTYL